VTEAWSSGEDPSVPLGVGTLSLIEGSTFCVSARGGDIIPRELHGLYVRDTRVLSRWILRVGGSAVHTLSVRQPDPYAAEVVGWASVGEDTPGHLVVIRRRYVGDGMREDIEVQNHSSRALDGAVTIDVDADFADVFEIKSGHVPGLEEVARDRTDEGVTMTGTRGGRTFSVRIHADRNAAPTEGGGLSFPVRIAARGSWRTSVEVVPDLEGSSLVPRHPRGQPVKHSLPAANLRRWRSRSPSFSTGDAALAGILSQSVEDLGSLRIFDPDHPERAIVAAGAPWFMAVFGRDSLLTSLMVLPIDASLALGTLQTLAAHQGTGWDQETEEQPGRILHEMRFGPTATLALGGGSVYYGTADATALFVMLIGELDRWRTHDEEVLALLPHADRAIEWIEGPGDSDGDGFVDYARSTDTGLANQGWKDSWDGVTYADGRVAEAPLALAEVQGYTYAAYHAMARLDRRHRGGRRAADYERRARRLRAAFNERFWLPERGWYAMALDGGGRPVDALGSNMGHCLWTGIVDEGHAADVAAHLLSPEMFTGWGIRTLATSMGAYDPVSYHNGSVWPHDNAVCAAGLIRYGFVDEAVRVARGILDAAGHFGGRLPELFCGLARTDFPEPVDYPTSCSPQAWAAAAPVEILRALSGFDPELVTAGPDEAVVAPRRVGAVPAAYLPLRVEDLRIGDGRFTLDIGDDGWRVTTADGDVVIATETPADGVTP
jgi:glycogen debranching enzyme